METPTIQVGGIIQISIGAIKEITSGDHKYHQDLEDKICNKLNLSLTKRKVYPLAI